MMDEFDSEEVVQPMYWAYRHVNGGIHLKMYTSRDSLDDAYDSDFVDDVVGPFPADSRKQAEEIAKKRLSKVERA